MISGKVLVTGGAGFLARGLYRQARAEGWDAEFTALSRDDAKHASLQASYPEVQTIRSDITVDLDFLAACFAGFDTVIHAAAVKYVDRSETAAWDTIRVNVEGSKNVALAAMRAGVRQVIGISTDKACEPINTYGMTKAVMERQFLEAHSLSPTAFSVVRYGNVVASTGSVIATFRQQVKAGNPITLTNAAHTRYWMSVHEAVDVILEGLKAPGLLTVYEPRAMSMRGLANVIARHGEEVREVGDRPGEKQHETIIHPQESERLVGPILDDVYHLAGPQARGSGKRFRLSSEHPSRLMEPDELLAMVQDAEAV